MVENLDTPYITAFQIDFKLAALLGVKPVSVCQDETKKQTTIHSISHK